MIKGLLILILFLIGTCFCSADLRYLTLRCRVGILACKIFSLFADFLFFMSAAFFYFIFARLGMKKRGDVDCEQFFGFKQTNKY